MRLVCLGEILWDVFGGTERIGGAPLNVAAHAARLGHEVAFVSAVGDDDRGRRALVELRRLGLGTNFITVTPELPTGHVTVTVDAKGQPDFTIHRPAAYDTPLPNWPQMEALRRHGADFICHGTLAQQSPQVHTLTGALIRLFPQAVVFYDVNLRRGCHTPELVTALLRTADILKLNEAETAAVAQMTGLPVQPNLESFCREMAERHNLQALCITRGAAGCAFWLQHQYREIPGHAVTVADAVGAGDAFAAAFLHGLSAAWPTDRIGDFANRVGALVASRPGAVPEWTVEEALALGNPVEAM